jgi:hypothetical protein
MMIVCTEVLIYLYASSYPRASQFYSLTGYLVECAAEELGSDLRVNLRVIYA